MTTIRKLFKYSFRIFIIICLLIVLFSLFQRSRQKEVSIAGISSYIILSDSMKPLFGAGDLVITQKIDTEELKVGDVITFQSRDPLTFGENITHEIYEINFENGQTLITTRGINLESIDQTPVYAEQVIGIYWFKLPKIGYFIDFMRTNTGFITLFVLPISLLILSEGIHFAKLYKSYVKEGVMNDLSVIDEETLKKALALIEKEKKESQEQKG
jgi:signal peptidase I